MHRLTTALGMPQNRFASIHVVGTNGKSSVARMTAELLEAHGVRAGASLSPHLHRWSERVLVRGREIGTAEFAAAVERAAQAAALVERGLDEGDRVTQFEVATAAAFVALAAARVEAAAVEAGLGGRLDASNVIPSRVTVLTSIGLDHTEWLGATVAEIAAEKLAVLRDATTLVTGDLPPEAAALAAGAAARRGARLVRAPADPGPDVELRGGGYQRRNFALAMEAVRAFLGHLDEEAVRAVACRAAVPGRLELVEGDPPLLLDAAHNPDGAAALAAALPALAAGRPVYACLAVLRDKDAEGIVRALAPAVAHVVATELPAAALEGTGRPGAASWPAAELAALARRAGTGAEAIAQPLSAVAHARKLAVTGGGVALLTGSHYLLGASWTGRHAQSSFR